MIRMAQLSLVHLSLFLRFVDHSVKILEIGTATRVPWRGKNKTSATNRRVFHDYEQADWTDIDIQQHDLSVHKRLRKLPTQFLFRWSIPKNGRKKKQKKIKTQKRKRRKAQTTGSKTWDAFETLCNNINNNKNNKKHEFGDLKSGEDVIFRGW